MTKPTSTQWISSILRNDVLKNFAATCSQWHGRAVSVVKEHKGFFLLATLTTLALSALALFRRYSSPKKDTPLPAEQPSITSQEANNSSKRTSSHEIPVHTTLTLRARQIIGEEKPVVLSRELSFSKLPHSSRFSACVNERELPELKQYAQGIVVVDIRNIIPAHLIGGADRFFISFSHQGQVFHEVYEAPRLVFEIFLRNMPYQEEVTIQILMMADDQVTSCEAAFTPDQVIGVYQLSQKEGKNLCLSSPLSKPITMAPYEAKRTGLIDTDINIAEPFEITVEKSGSLLIRKYDLRSGCHGCIESWCDHPIVLTLELTAEHPDIPVPAKNLSLPIVNALTERNEFSKEILFKKWQHAYRLATGQEPPRDPVIRMTGIQVDFLKNP